MVRIANLDMFGPYEQSDDEQYILVRQDSDRERGVGGYRDSGNGRFALTQNGQVVYSGECERPTEGAVSNAGTFAVADTLFGDRLASKLYVYDRTGELLLEREFSANTFNVGISDSGSFVVVQLCGSETDDSCKLYLFEINGAEVISQFKPQTGWADRYEFLESEKKVYLCYRKHGRKYAYSFDGEFLDSARYNKERIDDATSTDLVLIIQERFKDATNDQLPDLLTLVNRCFDDNLSSYPDYLALAYRLKGEIEQSLGSNGEAIASYRKAIALNPKIGVKRKLNKLEKEAGIGITKIPPSPGKQAVSQRLGGSPILSPEVLEIVYNFTQYAFIGASISAEPIKIQRFPEVLAMLQSGELTQQDIAGQHVEIQRLLYELLTQYIMFLTMNPELPFPPVFLEGSSAKVLGAEITAYMAHYKWPFPQMLPSP